MKVELMKESWENLLKVIRQSDIKTEGNFWACIHRIEEQMEELLKREGFCKLCGESYGGDY